MENNNLVDPNQAVSIIPLIVYVISICKLKGKDSQNR